MTARFRKVVTETLASIGVRIGLILSFAEVHMRNRARVFSYLLGVSILSAPLAFGQQTTTTTPPAYRGVNVHVDGVFVTPVPNVPFSAVVELESSQVLPDGSTDQKKTFNNIARDASGRIYNERRSLTPVSFNGTPRILLMHIFDPESRLNTFLDPSTHIARQSVFTKPMVDPASGSQGEDLGSDMMESVEVHGTRTSRTIPAQFSGTGQAIVITDEYWYSADLHLNMLVKHNDPRTGEQTVTVTHLNRSEPDEARFQIPASYKVVDETPVSQ
jgi:hypothetical protein